jgi:pimeloyl-ACP methyl ester carboxylesterase
MSVTTLSGTALHYEAAGRGRPLLFLHGWLGSWRYWWSAMQSLAAGYRVYALDLPGFGDSSDDLPSYSLDGYTRMVWNFVSRMGLAPPVVIAGHGLGAAVALRYGRDHADQVGRLALISLPLKGSDIHSQLGAMPAAEFWARNLARNAGYAPVAREIHKADPRAVEQLTAELRQQEFADDLDRCRFPLLAIYGVRDPVVAVPPELDALLQWPLINHQYAAIDDWGHFPMLEQPAQFNRLLRDFLVDDDHQLLTLKAYWRRRTR